mmetsp:Transcript_84524/g.242691  ORF Transcript_84524/g.242691 Transcript_84524/m.242691 type:complete len:267 (-) Transcript_84524:270-1070(-)
MATPARPVGMRGSGTTTPAAVGELLPWPWPRGSLALRRGPPTAARLAEFGCDLPLGCCRPRPRRGGAYATAYGDLWCSWWQPAAPVEAAPIGAINPRTTSNRSSSSSASHGERSPNSLSTTRLITSAGRSSRSSSGCQGNSTPTRREASYLSSSFEQRMTSLVTVCPKRSLTSSRESPRTPPRACHLNSPVCSLYGRNAGSPSKLTSCKMPSSSGKHPPCSSPTSLSERPFRCTKRSSRRPRTFVGTTMPRWLARSAASRAARTCS